MSYDISFDAEHCCDGHGENITSNLRAMFHEAEIVWPDLNGKSGRMVGRICLVAVEDMLRDPDRFKAHNPENGWGNYDGALAFLVRVARHCLTHPDATVEVSW